jgi:hypothetical protein
VRSSIKKFWLLASMAAISSCSIRNSVEVKKLTDRFIEIKAPTEKVWFGCSEINPEDHLAIMNFYVKDGSITHQFLYRRLHDTKFCNSLLKNYQKLVRDANRVTIVGTTNQYEPEETEKSIENVPIEFATGHKQIANWTFVRLQTEKGCEAYFDEDCKPENYWGGLTPH